MQRFTIGADPEIFFMTKEGVPKSAEGLLPGVKHNAARITDRIEVMIDNVSAEFATTPVDNSLDFLKTIEEGIAVLKEFAESAGLSLHTRCVARFGKKDLSTHNAMEFGCDPDYNAYTGKFNQHPEASDPTMRTCGGHIHVGYDTKTAPPEGVVFFMDVLIGLPLLLTEQEWERAELYGKLGTYRPKPYGVEYRSASNYWIFDPKLVEFVYEQTAKVMQIVAGDLKLDNDLRRQLISQTQAVREAQEAKLPIDVPLDKWCQTLVEYGLMKPEHAEYLQGLAAAKHDVAAA